MTVRIEHGDCLSIIPRLVAEGIVVDSVVCDPPYNLEAMAKRFGPKQKAAASPDHQRFAKGFMGMTWDTDVAVHPETWVTIATIMRPGAFLLAFGGCRTYHRLVCAIEDAGFVIQDCLMYLFGSGFPKRRDMLKPAYEPICVSYKPGGKRTLQVDECRVGLTIEPQIGGLHRGSGNTVGCYIGDHVHNETPKARWPANLAHDGSEQVLEAFPDARASGDYPSDSRNPGNAVVFGSPKNQGPIYVDAGSAARFFYSSKADKLDRWSSRHPTVKPVELMRWLVPLVTPKNGLVLDPFAGSGTTGAAAMITERNAILIEREDQYVQDILDRIEFLEKDENYRVFQNADKSQARADINSLKNAPEKGWWKD